MADTLSTIRFYDELAEWWPLFSPPTHYVEEADDLLRRLADSRQRTGGTLLELGCGGGSLASHLASNFTLTLTDRAPGMLAISQHLNPEAEHIVGDMRTLRLGRRFDVVLIHDAIMYATTPDDVRAALGTAAEHCHAEGRVIVLPDFITETFGPGIEDGGEDGDDGRALRYLEWTWDPDPADHTYVADYAFLLREPDGTVTAVHDRHIEGLFSLSQWQTWLHEAGLAADTSVDRWGRHVFIAKPR
jgi:SAM-dependent methyltransferase